MNNVYYMYQRQTISKKNKRINKSILDKLYIIDTYNIAGVYLSFLNKWNPFTYILLLPSLIIAPFYCMFTSTSLQDVFKEIYNGIMGKYILKDK